MLQARKGHGLSFGRKKTKLEKAEEMSPMPTKSVPPSEQIRQAVGEFLSQGIEQAQERTSELLSEAGLCSGAAGGETLATGAHHRV